jgi:hypothetical protein
MKTLQTLQQLREMKHNMELLRIQEQKQIEFTWDRVKRIYPKIYFAFELYRMFRRKKTASKKENKNWFDHVRAWTFSMIKSFTQTH